MHIHSVKAKLWRMFRRRSLKETDGRLTPSLPRPVQFPGWKVHTYTPENSIFHSPVSNPLSVQRIFIEILWRVHANKGNGLNDQKFGTSIGRLPVDGAGSMAVKGLRRWAVWMKRVNCYRFVRSKCERSSVKWALETDGQTGTDNTDISTMANTTDRPAYR